MGMSDMIGCDQCYFYVQLKFIGGGFQLKFLIVVKEKIMDLKYVDVELGFIILDVVGGKGFLSSLKLLLYQFFDSNIKVLVLLNWYVV